MFRGGYGDARSCDIGENGLPDMPLGGGRGPGGPEKYSVRRSSAGIGGSGDAIPISLA